MTSDREPGPSKQPAVRNPGGRHSKRKKEGEEEVVEHKSRFLKRKKEEAAVAEQSEDELETVEGGDDQGAREDKGRTFVEDGVVESSEEDEVRVQVERLVNGKSKARAAGTATGRTSTKQRKQAASRLSKKALEIQGSDEEENEEADIIEIDAPPLPPTKHAKAGRVNGVSEKKGKKRMDGSELDELLSGQDGVVALIDKIGTPGSVNPNATARDAEATRLKEKISRVSGLNFTCSRNLPGGLAGGSK